MLPVSLSSSNQYCHYDHRHPINVVIIYHHRHPINVVIIIIVIQSMLSLSSSSSNKCWHGSETGSPVTGRTWCCVPELVRASGPASSSWRHQAAVRAVTGRGSWYPRRSIPFTQPASPSTTWSRSIFVSLCITIVISKSSTVMKKNNGMLVFGVPANHHVWNWPIRCHAATTNQWGQRCVFTVDHRRLNVAVVECSISPC